MRRVACLLLLVGVASVGAQVGLTEQDVQDSVAAAEALAKAGRFADAVKGYTTALHRATKVFGPDDLRTMRVTRELAVQWLRSGQPARAEPLNRRVLEARKRKLGEAHPDVAQSYSDLGSVLEAAGKFAEARPLIEKSLAVREQALGKDHPDTAGSQAQLGRLFTRQGKFAEAVPLLERALDTYQVKLGKEHPQVAFVLFDLGKVYGAQGKAAQATATMEQSLTIARKALGNDHPFVIRVRQELGAK